MKLKELRSITSFGQLPSVKSDTERTYVAVSGSVVKEISSKIDLKGKFKKRK
jgi:hypothetical protein